MQRCLIASFALHGLALAGAARLETASSSHVWESRAAESTDDIPTFELDLRGTDAFASIDDSADAEGGDGGDAPPPEALITNTVPIPVPLVAPDVELTSNPAPVEPDPTLAEPDVTSMPIPAADDDTAPVEDDPIVFSDQPAPIAAAPSEAARSAQDSSTPREGARSDPARGPRMAWPGALARFAAARAIVKATGTGSDGRAGGPSSMSASASAHGQSFAPRPLATDPPDYPRACVRRGIEGRTLCRMHVDATGHVEGVDIMESSGNRELDRAAASALRRWRFEPPLRAGRPIASFVLHWVTFRLR